MQRSQQLQALYRPEPESPGLVGANARPGRRGEESPGRTLDYPI
jgi:hypothetical protein